MFVREGDPSILLWCHHDLHSIKTFSLVLTSKIPCCTPTPFYGVLREVTAHICQPYLFVSKIINWTFGGVDQNYPGRFFSDTHVRYWKEEHVVRISCRHF